MCFVIVTALSGGLAEGDVMPAVWQVDVAQRALLGFKPSWWLHACVLNVNVTDRDAGEGGWGGGGKTDHVRTLATMAVVVRTVLGVEPGCYGGSTMGGMLVVVVAEGL